MPRSDYPDGMDERTLARFWAKISVNDETGCWEWTASKDTRGYSKLSVDGKTVRAHRLVWELLRSPIPDGLQLDHRCRVRSCVRPEHLEPVDQRTNILRGIAPTAVNATKTECVNGHPFDEANTYLYPDGKRDCRTCRRLRDREYWRSRSGGRP